MAEPLLEVADLCASVHGKDQPSVGASGMNQGCGRVGQLGRRQVDERVPPQSGRPPRACGGRLSRRGRRPRSFDRERRQASFTIAGKRSIPGASAPRSPRYAVTCPGPDPNCTTGLSGQWSSTRSSSQVDHVVEHPVEQPGLDGSPRGSSTRWSAYAVATAWFDGGQCVAQVRPPVITASPSTVTAAALAEATVREIDPGGSCCPGRALELAHQRRGRSDIRRRHASTSPGWSNRTSVGPGSQPARRLSAPEQQTPSRSARSSGSTPSRSSRFWSYFCADVRRPVSDHTDPQQPDPSEGRAVRSEGLLVEVDHGIPVARLVAGAP